METSICILEVKESKIHGLGCFARSVIEQGELIIEYTGELIDRDEAIRRSDSASRDYSQYILSLNDRLFIDGAKSGNESRFINHSCQPDCFIQRVENHAYIVAGRRIAMGEELTIDYNYDSDFREACFCGAPNCRGYM